MGTRQASVVDASRFTPWLRGANPLTAHAVGQWDIDIDLPSIPHRYGPEGQPVLLCVEHGTPLAHQIAEGDDLNLAGRLITRPGRRVVGWP